MVLAKERGTQTIGRWLRQPYCLICRFGQKVRISLAAASRLGHRLEWSPTFKSADPLPKPVTLISLLSP